MHKSNLSKEKKLELTKLEILLLTEMGIFRILKNRVIRFNIRPFFKAIFYQKKKPIIPEEKPVDLHLDIIKKLDESVTTEDQEMNNKDSELTIKSSLSERVEIREPLVKTFETPINNEIAPKGVLGELDKIEEFYDFENPINASPEIQQLKDDDIQSSIKVDDYKKSKKLFWDVLKMIGMAKSKEITKVDATPKVNNNVVKTQKELEKTKHDIEIKRKELEMVIQREKEKELELKKIEEEKRKQEKLRQIELKKKMKEKQLKEKEAKKIEKERKKQRILELRKKEEEKRKQEKLRQIELKKKLREKQLKEKEAKKIEKEKEKELKLKKIQDDKLKAKMEAEKEKKRQLELRKSQEEKIKQEKLREIELKKKLKEDKLKVKSEVEKEKEKELKIKKQKEEGFKLLKRKDVKPEPISSGPSEKEKTEELSEWDVDVEKLIPIIDNLLEKLPDEVIDKFAQSEDFNLYEKVILKYKNK